VTIFLETGAAFYFFNFKPLQEKILKQEEKLEQEKNANIEKFEKLAANIKLAQDEVINQAKTLREELSKSIETKVEAAEKRVETIEISTNKEITEPKNSAKVEKLTNLWERQYFWNMGGLKVSSNTILQLILYLEEAVKENLFIASLELCLNSISEALDDREKEQSQQPGVKEQDQILHDRLVNILNKVRDYDKKISEIKNKAKKVLMPPINLEAVDCGIARHS
jgi:hypothetical protein